MHPTSLTASQLDRWLAERGMELKESCWHILRSGCRDHVVFDYQLVIDQVPWQGAAHLLVSFVQCSKLRLAGWCISDSPSQLPPDDEILVIGLVLQAIISYPRRLQRPSSWLTPHINQPEYGIKIEHPTLEDLNMAWEALSLVAPHAYDALEMLCLELEGEIGKLAAFQ